MIGVTEFVIAAAAVVVASAVIMYWRDRTAQRRFRVLADIAAVSDAGGALGDTFEAICDILVPELADFCMIDVIEDGRARRAAVRTGPSVPPELERGIADRNPSTPEHMLDEAGRASLRPRFLERMPDELLREMAEDGEDLSLLRRLAPRSTITVALNARGRVTGALTLGLVSSSRRRYRRADVRFAWILSGRVALALDNAGLFDDLERAERARGEIAETLQRGLLPPPLPDIPGWSVAAMYRPAGAQNEVGGDFYDVFRVPDGWMLAIGDVTGRGAQAASVTAVARYTLRTAALLSDDPIVALATVNRTLLARGDSALCSMVAMVLSEDPFASVRLAIAGHPPPLLVDGEDVRETASADPVLGAFPDAIWGMVETEVRPGQQLVVVTDGIAEARGVEGHFGERRLREQLRGASNPARAPQRLEKALTEFTGGTLDDDVAILSLSRERQTTEDEPEPLLARLYESFNRRDEAGIAELCDERMKFYPVVTAEAVGRVAPYEGADGLREYMSDVAEVWEELQLTPVSQERRGSRILVRGRVYARSRELGIRDMPVAWIWEIRDGRVVSGEVFPDPDLAATRFAEAVAA